MIRVRGYRCGSGQVDVIKTGISESKHLLVEVVAHYFESE